MTVLEARESKSRPQIGLIRSSWAVFNQQGEQVLSMEGWGMFGRRDAPAGMKRMETSSLIYGLRSVATLLAADPRRVSSVVRDEDVLGRHAAG